MDARVPFVYRDWEQSVTQPWHSLGCQQTLQSDTEAPVDSNKSLQIGTFEGLRLRKAIPHPCILPFFPEGKTACWQWPWPSQGSLRS